MVNDQVLPFQLAVPALDLARLRARIADTRWPEPQTVPDNSQGTPILKLRALCEYWQEHYDWRRCEDALNTFGQYRTQIDGVDICFIHVRRCRTGEKPPTHFISSCLRCQASAFRGSRKRRDGVSRASRMPGSP